MPQSNIGVNSPLARKKFAGQLFRSTVASSFWVKSMIEDVYRVDKDGQMANAPVGVVNDLQSEAGDAVSFDIYVQLRGRPTFGDDNLEGNLDSLDPYTDEIKINQVRHGVDVGGRMSNKRTVNNQRAVAKTQLSEYFAQLFDQTLFTQLAGARGISNEYLIPKNANTAIAGTAPYSDYDAAHTVYGGSAVSKATVTASDKMSLNLVDRLITKATTEGGGADGAIRVQPLDKGGEDAYVLLMHPYQEHDLRKDVGTAGWVDMQKAAAGAEGLKSPIFKNKLGEHRGVIMKSHKHVVRFDNYGVGANVPVARAALMGRQALVLAFGSASSAQQRAEWTEKYTDVDNNRLAISGRMVFNAKRPEFNGQTANSYAVDTAAVAP